MASTNKTTGLDLSQFIATDKPSWLGDYNSDMSKIDGGYTSIKAEAEGASGSAVDAKNTANAALAAANAAINDISQIKKIITYAPTNPNISKFTSYSFIIKKNNALNLYNWSAVIGIAAGQTVGDNEVVAIVPAEYMPNSIASFSTFITVQFFDINAKFIGMGMTTFDISSNSIKINEMRFMTGKSYADVTGISINGMIMDYNSN